MYKDKKVRYSLIGLISLISVQAAIRSIGIDNLSSQAVVALFTIISVFVIAVQYKYRAKGFGVKYNMTVAILMTLACFFTALMLVIFKGPSDLADKYGGFTLLLSLLSFFALTLYIIIYRVVYEIKHK